jgi:hypothetical protein
VGEGGGEAVRDGKRREEGEKGRRKTNIVPPFAFP